MDAYQELRKQAVKKRDLAIAAARAEYHDAINAIEKLRSAIGENNHAPKPKRFKPLLDAMADAIPKEGRFTFEELLRAMTLAEPSRAINSLSVRSLLPRMEAQGIIQRITKNQRGRVEWAAAGAAVVESRFGAMPLVDVAEQVLRARGPMPPTELVVAIRETGYRADADPQRLLAALRQAVRRNRERFSEADGRWQVGVQAWL